jgi:hypothetical protein
MSPLALGCTLALAACVDSTGGARVHFQVAVAGPADAQSPLAFSSGRFGITLLRCQLHVGAVYLNRNVPTSGAQPTSCFAQGTEGQGSYVGEVTQQVGDVVGLDVDLLSPDPQYFTEAGQGTADHASTGEVWLMGGAIDADSDTTVVLDTTGIATENATGRDYPFSGSLTIGSNRRIPITDPSQPGANPLCKQRIVSVSRQLEGQDVVPVDVPLAEGITILVRADPRQMFGAVDFSQLPFASPYRFGDTSDPGPDLSLYTGLRATVGVYSFEVLK